MRAIVAVLVVVGCWLGIAYAEDAAPTVITGRVTDVLGRPVPNARVEVVPTSGQPQQTTTDKDGRYRVTVAAAGTHRIVIAFGNTQTTGAVIAKPGETTTLDLATGFDLEGGEVIRIEDRVPPTVKPKLKRETQRPLDYSKEAFERDVWARAWLLLDVDESGRVTRLKLLKTPGFGLEKIAIDAAFGLKFEPAKDASGSAMKTYLLWTMEWPAWGWRVSGGGVGTRRRPGESAPHVYTPGHAGSAPTTFQFRGSPAPCWGTGPLQLDLHSPAYRDCSLPDMQLAETLPWITRETAATAVTELVAIEQARPLPRRGSPVPGYVGVGLTSGMLAATIVSFVKFSSASARLVEHGQQFATPDVLERDTRTRYRWRNITIGMSAATVLIGGATLYLWNRHHPNFNIHPTSQGSGATATYTTSW